MTARTAMLVTALCGGLLSPAVAGSQASAPGPSGPSVGLADGAGADFFVGRADEAGSDQADPVVRRYSLAALLPPLEEDTERVQPLYVAPGTQYWFEEQGFDPGRLRPSMDADAAASLLADALGDDLRFEGRALEVLEGGILMLVAPEEVQAKAGKILSGLTAALSSQIVLSVDVVTDAQGQLPFPASAQIADADAERLVAMAVERGASHVRHEVVVSPGSIAMSDITRPVALVGDYDVEIAQNAAIWDPITSVIDVGQRLTVMGSPRDGKALVAGVLRTSELIGEVEERAFDAAMLVSSEKAGVTYGEGPQLIQAATVAQSAYAFSGELGGGQALICASELTLPNQRRSQIVVLRALSVQGQAVHTVPLDGGRSLMVVDTSAFTTPGANVFAVREELESWARLSGPYLAASLSVEAPSFLSDLLERRFNLSYSYGPWRMLVPDPTYDRGGAEAVDALAASWPSAAATATLALDLASSGVADGMPARGLVPCIRGQEAAVLVGVARNTVWDYDVEVAQNAAVADPTVSNIFSGLGVIASVQDRLDGSSALDVEAYGFQPAGPPEVLEVSAREFRYFDRQDHDTLQAKSRRALGEDGTAVFGPRARNASSQVLQLRAAVR